jgi:hypothetical protein
MTSPLILTNELCDILKKDGAYPTYIESRDDPAQVERLKKFVDGGGTVADFAANLKEADKAFGWPAPTTDQTADALLATKVKNATGKNRSLANQALVVKHFEAAGHSPKVAAHMADEAMRARGGKLGSLAPRIKPGKTNADVGKQSSNPWKNTGPEAMAARGSYISRMGLPKAREMAKAAGKSVTSLT